MINKYNKDIRSKVLRILQQGNDMNAKQQHIVSLINLVNYEYEQMMIRKQEIKTAIWNDIESMRAVWDEHKPALDKISEKALMCKLKGQEFIVDAPNADKVDRDRKAALRMTWEEQKAAGLNSFKYRVYGNDEGYEVQHQHDKGTHWNGVDGGKTNSLNDTYNLMLCRIYGSKKDITHEYTRLQGRDKTAQLQYGIQTYKLAYTRGILKTVDGYFDRQLAFEDGRWMVLTHKVIADKVDETFERWHARNLAEFGRLGELANPIDIV